MIAVGFGLILVDRKDYECWNRIDGIIGLRLFG